MSSYVVNWERADGEPGWHPVADVQEATTYVEHLRNAEGVETTHIYRLDEVAFEFRPYYKVELSVPQTSFAARIVPEPDPVPEPSMALAVPDAPEESPSPSAWSTVPETDGDGESTNGSARRGLFGR